MNGNPGEKPRRYTCCICQKEKDLLLFYPLRLTPQPLCRDCANRGKHCSKCKVYKPFSQFPKAPGSVNRGGVATYCLTCKGERNKQTYDPTRQRARILKARFRITSEEYDRLYARQGGVCAICQQPETALSRNGTVQPLAVDHDHTTSDVRGLLCMRCNLLLGMVEKDYDRVEKMLEYIRGVRKEES